MHKKNPLGALIKSTLRGYFSYEISCYLNQLTTSLANIATEATVMAPVAIVEMVLCHLLAPGVLANIIAVSPP